MSDAAICGIRGIDLANANALADYGVRRGNIDWPTATDGEAKHLLMLHRLDLHDDNAIYVWEILGHVFSIFVHAWPGRDSI